MRQLPEAAPRRSPQVWVVAADAARARIFRARRSDGALTEIEDLANPDVRRLCESLGSDGVFDKAIETDALIDYCLQLTKAAG